MQPRRHRSYDVYREPERSLRRPTTPKLYGQSMDGIKPVHTPKAIIQDQHVSRPTLKAPTKTTLPHGHVLDASTNKLTLKSSRFHLKAFALTTMAVVIFVTGGVVSYMNWRTNKQVAAWVNNQAGSEDGGGNNTSSDGDTPDETEPQGESSSYRVAADLPRMLRIGEIQVTARVKPLGVKNNNELKAPSNIYDVGWYEASSKPGTGGTTLLDGHVHGPTKPGIFYNLKKLKVDSLIEVERGDGQKISYKVVKMQKYAADKVDMAAALTPVIPGKEALNLITCAGNLDKKTNTYPDRLIVFATRVD